MWLLNTRTYELRNYVSGRTPTYAILSHCWSEGEVSFADIQDLRVARGRPGWMKVARACQYALRWYGCFWIWDDTCCIDKSSSAELSEAINSMLTWYQTSKICIVYLHDVVDEEVPNSASLSFRGSRWFTRGWTLQELIAPSNLVFVSNTWRQLGTRMDWATVLENITGIDAQLLNRSWSPVKLLSARSVAERMSWASKRETTRPEDMAYCLMGLFNVNMPTIYGEGGPGAFRRLQLEIIQRSNDHSIFAWGHYHSESSLSGPISHAILGAHVDWSPGPLLAPSPAHFRAAAAAGVRKMMDQDDTATWLGISHIQELHYTNTNAGIRIQLPLRRTYASFRCPSRELPVYCAALGCHIINTVEGRPSDRCSPTLVGLLLACVENGVYVCVEGRDSLVHYLREADTAPFRLEAGRLVTLPISTTTTSNGGGFEDPHQWQVKTIYIRTDIEAY